jgi:predicted anti-sigma-YlaC factor YlaD
MPRLAAGLLPTLLFFLLVLAAVSIWDLARGDATTARVASHAIVLAGALLLVAVSRTHPRPGPSTTRQIRDDVVLLGVSTPDDDILGRMDESERRDLPPTGRRTA